WCAELVLGARGLIILYVVGAYSSALGQWLADPNAMVPMVGASGAISAVIGAYSLSFGGAQSFTASPALNRWINAIWLMLAWVLLQLAIGWLAGAQGLML